MKPSDFERHTGKGNRRFLTRERNGEMEVYGCGLDHLCWARDLETAQMIADALEFAAVADGMVKGETNTLQQRDVDATLTLTQR